MHITIKWFNDSFNVGLAAREGAEEFLSIKGCRIKEANGKTFVSFPSQKSEKTGKWWNHVWASDKFQAAVIERAREAAPKPQSAQQTKDGRKNTFDDMSDDIPWQP